MHALSHTRRHEGRATVIELTGEIDVATAPQLRSSLEPAFGAPEPRLVIDLAGVTFIDSSGLRVLIETHKRAEQDGGSLALARPSPWVVRLLRVTGLDRRIAVHPDVAEAAE
ncbi:STAS domain-containing protein [Allonocardiopsis opalescens]|uniref:Anti-sigma factor antagonist n=1 Tax=Allonocardiopsis opalescens TaxID=1144618 RepID=A0A2T0QCQ1_9ACTN|nr:STAS domain-containing protein [Allonocardiopsis opalescens]PRY01650.1 anti-sigma B factor antagonist [Allonocardiopsis opalescens]